MHDIMNLNDDKDHMAHNIVKYFELHRCKKAVMLLIKPTVRRKGWILDEKQLTKI